MYDLGEEKRTSQGVECFEVQCQYLDFDGKVFGAVTERLAIEKVSGASVSTRWAHFQFSGIRILRR